MTYIRMTGGRDRGEVKDFPLPDAQEMLALGQALPVNFDEPDPLGFREIPVPIANLQMPTANCQEPVAEAHSTLKKKKTR
jgi:hypothetical protein